MRLDLGEELILENGMYPIGLFSSCEMLLFVKILGQEPIHFLDFRQMHADKTMHFLPLNVLLISSVSFGTEFVLSG